LNKKSKYFDGLVQLVAVGESVLSACNSIGCHKTTGYRLSRMPEFQQQVNEIRTELMKSAMGSLSAAASAAVQTMVDLLQSPEDSVRLRSAIGILDRFSRLSENVDLRARIEKLEQVHVNTQ
jgi:hypothetical protein